VNAERTGSQELDDPETDAAVVVRSAGLFLLRRRRWIAVGAATAFALAMTYVFLRPRHWSSTTRFEVQSRQGAGGASALAAQFGILMPGSPAGPSPAFFAQLVETHDLLAGVAEVPAPTDDGRTVPVRDLLRPDEKDLARRRERAVRDLAEAIRGVVDARAGLVTITVTTQWPQVSQTVAASVLAAIQRYNTKVRQSQASIERQFTEARVNDAGIELRNAENRFLDFARANRGWETARVPDIPAQGKRLEYDVQLKQSVYTTLMQSFEQARIEELRDTPAITVVDVPNLPLWPDSRGVFRWAVGSVVLGGVLGLLGALAAELRRSMASFPLQRAGDGGPRSPT
jgi:uncharacterized protein involved in exopolysaccharide biosynthesis